VVAWLGGLVVKPEGEPKLVRSKSDSGDFKWQSATTLWV
jgi:hypothetical protein